MTDLPFRPALKNLKPYIPGQNPKEPGIIKLASNENPFGPSPMALEEIKHRLKDLHIYPDQFALELKQKLAAKLRVSENNLIIGAGEDEIMQFAAATYLSTGDEVIIAKNTYSTYEFVTRLFEGVPVFVKLNGYNYDLAEIEKKITPKTKMIFLCSPNNPTGTILDQTKLDEFINKLPKSIIVLIDEAYAEYVESSNFQSGIKYVLEGKNVIVMKTFSKIYGLAGLRVGYGIARSEIINHLNMTKMPFNVSRPAIAGAIGALQDSEYFEKSLINNYQGKKYLYKELKALEPKVSYVETEANFILINLKQNADEIFLQLMREGIIVRPLTSFGLPNAIRVTIGTPEQNQKFMEALKKIIG